MYHLANLRRLQRERIRIHEVGYSKLRGLARKVPDSFLNRVIAMRPVSWSSGNLNFKKLLYEKADDALGN